MKNPRARGKWAVAAVVALKTPRVEGKKNPNFERIWAWGAASRESYQGRGQAKYAKHVGFDRLQIPKQIISDTFLCVLRRWINP
jgi:hypothetical protein